MDDQKLQELIIGYALDILEEQERQEADELLKSNSAARALLAEFEEVTFALALSVEPVEMPVGSLARLRQKAGVGGLEPAAADELKPLSLIAHVPTTGIPIGPATGTGGPTKFNNSSATVPVDFRQKTRSNSGSFGRSSWLAYAAALVLFLTTAVFGILWMSSQNELNSTENSRRNLAQILSSPGLRVAELKPVAGNAPGSMRVYTDPATDKAYLVAQNLAVLPAGKEYEAWFVTADNQARKAGLLGTGDGKDGLLVYELQTNGQIEQYEKVAITIEQKGGVEKSTQQPVMTGNIA